MEIENAVTARQYVAACQSDKARGIPGNLEGYFRRAAESMEGLVKFCRSRGRDEAAAGFEAAARVLRAAEAGEKAGTPLTGAEAEALGEHGFPWASDYTPTIRIEGRGRTLRTPSCKDVPTAQVLRSACVKLGIGYFDGRQIIGRR